MHKSLMCPAHNSCVGGNQETPLATRLDFSHSNAWSETLAVHRLSHSRVRFLWAIYVCACGISNACYIYCAEGFCTLVPFIGSWNYADRSLPSWGLNEFANKFVDGITKMETCAMSSLLLGTASVWTYSLLVGKLKIRISRCSHILTGSKSEW